MAAWRIGCQTDWLAGGLLQSVCFYDYGFSRHVVKALREYSVGEQVFMSYGRMSNDEAVQFYGFLEQGNDADTYTLSRLPGWLEQHLGRPLPAVRLAELKEAKLLKALQEVSQPCARSAPGLLSDLVHAWCSLSDLELAYC